MRIEVTAFHRTGSASVSRDDFAVNSHGEVRAIDYRFDVARTPAGAYSQAQWREKSSIAKT
jgi:hypothetical protein